MNTKFKKIAVFLVVVMTMVSVSANAFAWGGIIHLRFVNQNESLISNDQLAAFKLGSIFADLQAEKGGKYYYKGYDEYGKETLHGGVGSNYEACYIFLTKVAVALGNRENVTKNGAVKVDGMTTNDFNCLKGYVTYYNTNGEWKGKVGGYNISDVFKDTARYGKYSEKYGVELGKIPNSFANRKAFVYGIALHIATDTFAHNAYEIIDNGWVHIEHPRADWITENGSGGVFNKRYYAAQQAAKNVLESYYNGGCGSADDFFVDESFFIDGNFRIGII